MPTNAEVMAKTLAERGVEYVFGLPGGEIVAFIDACRRAGIRFLLTGHESSAAWMAQVLGQITGIPGVCAATLGPGATNLVTGIANAFLDRAPVVAVTAQIPKRAMPTMTHQRLALDALFAPITKASMAVGEEDTAGLILRAMDLAIAPRPGPVHVSLASDLAIEEAPSKPCRADPARVTTPIDPIAQRLNAAQRPLVLIGLGATPHDAPAIRALIDRLQAPFLVTPKVKGIASEDHPMFLGVASGMAIDRDILETIRAADLVLAIGFDPVECDKTWFAGTPIVSIDSASMAEGDYRPLEAIGNIAVLVSQLQIDSKPWPPDLLAQRRAAMGGGPPGSRPIPGSAFSSHHQRDQGIARGPGGPPPIAASGISPLRMIEELRAVFPRDGIVTCDVGSHKLVMGQFWRSYEPGTFFMSNGLSGMGFGIPAAVAAQLAHPERSVMAVVGDGGMLMMLHDLVLIRELGLPIVIVVFTDRSLSLIRVSESRRGIEPYGVDFCPPDFAAAAQAFGIASHKCATIPEARAAVERALTERVPFLVDVSIDHREYYDLV
ncbi:MAG TPA: thiamine pyrophosphate-binding protein [Bryobacteraceae bacterium]|nr:thiamine pyrophosphate-binding protein [Bryobacteraceae bacterium]